MVTACCFKVQKYVCLAPPGQSKCGLWHYLHTAGHPFAAQEWNDTLLRVIDETIGNKPEWEHSCVQGRVRRAQRIDEDPRVVHEFGFHVILDRLGRSLSTQKPVSRWSWHNECSDCAFFAKVWSSCAVSEMETVGPINTNVEG